MKRSEINHIIREAAQFIESFRFSLPPFAHWSVEDWAGKGHECDEIRDNMLGWDITDYGEGDFTHAGLVLLTLRNGSQQQPDTYPKPYAEKLLISQEDQLCPMHFHWYKMEDIINRGGGIMMMKIYKATASEELSDEDVEILCDGVRSTVPAGTVLEFHPGQSITLMPQTYHSFWAKAGHGAVLIGEVSKTNDDNTDNRFYDPIGRFPSVEEDEPIFRYLCNEYPPAK